MAGNSSKNHQKESSKMLNPPPKETNGLDVSKSSNSSKVGPSCTLLLDKIRQIFQRRRNCVDVDVHLLARRFVDDVTETDVLVPCHKIFLRTCPYFLAILDAAPANEPGQICKIDTGLDHEILEEILRYIYTGEMQINPKNWIQLFQASIKMELNEQLMVKFTKFQIGALINEDNWLEMLRIFNSAGAGDSCGKFMKEIYGYLREKSSELMNSPSFLQLTFDEVRLILNPESRIFKNSRDFQASLLTWLAHETNSKSHLISQLSACSYVELPEIIDLVEPAEDQSQEHNYNGTTESSSNSEDLEPLAKRTRLNCNLSQFQSPALSLLFCSDNHFYTYSFQEKKCVQLGSLPTLNLDGFSMVLANDKVYILGGHVRNTTSFSMSRKVTSCPLAELQANQKVNWKDEKELGEIANFSTLYVNGNIYTIGGLINIRKNSLFHKPLWWSCVLSSREEVQNEKWKYAFCYNFARSQCAVAQLNGKIYIVKIGGIGINQNLRLRDNVWERGPDRAKLGVELIAIESVEVFNITEKVLGSVADLKLARFDHQAVVFQDKIFVIGGKVIKYGSIYEKDTDSVEVYDPNTNSWTNGPSLNVPRANFAAFVVDDKIFVLGGNLGKPTMEVYDPRKNKWSLEPCGDFPAKTNFSQFVIIK